MTPGSGAAADCRAGFVHEAAIYDSDEQFLAAAVPFLREGVAAGEPTLVAVGERQEHQLREGVGDAAAGVDFFPGDTSYAEPLAALKANRDLWTEYVRAGAKGVRILGQIPAPALAANWSQWARYEGAVGHVCEPLPVRGVCLYDTRTTPGPVLDDVLRAHPRLMTAGAASASNDLAADPAGFLAERLRGTPDPLERTTPMVELSDPALDAARAAVGRLAKRAGLDRETIDDLVFGVNEAITNGYVHGRPPVVVRAWAGPGRAVATVTDTGPGPASPFAGLVPAPDAGINGGLGLWMTHRRCATVDRLHTPEGFTLRLIATASSGTPAP